MNTIAAAEGTLLTSPFDFTTFYNRYADSWRVSARESLLSVCGAKHAEGNPRKPFYAADLTPEVYQRTRSVCTTAGVKDPTLLDACTLDVAVIGNNQRAASLRWERRGSRRGKLLLYQLKTLGR